MRARVILFGEVQVADHSELPDQIVAAAVDDTHIGERADR